MTLHIATTAAFKPGCCFEVPTCPTCGDMLFAPVSALLAASGHIQQMWACDDCGYAFRTSVRLAGGAAVRPFAMQAAQ